MTAISAKSAKPAQPALTPARAELRFHLARLAAAQKRLAEAQEPIAALTRIHGSAVVGEAAELRAEIARLRQSHNQSLGMWVDGGARGSRPSEPADLAGLERRLGEIATEAAAAGPKIEAAQIDVAAATAALRETATARDEALGGAAIEACAEAIERIELLITAALQHEGRARGVVAELRRLGDVENNRSAYGAAAKIEEAIRVAKQKPGVAIDFAAGRKLIEALKTNPSAKLGE